jgi:hypothetical protein
MTAKEAKDKGFIDEIITGKGVKAQFDHSVFANLPKEFKNDFEEKQEPDIRSIEKLLRDVGGLSKNKAKALLARGWPTDGESTETDNETPQAETPKIEVIHWDDSIVARLTKNINQMRGI